MKYTYVTATEKIEVEVDERLYDVLAALDRKEYNSNRKHYRRDPISLENADYEGPWFSTGGHLLDGLLHAEERERLRAAFKQLTPDQRALLLRAYFKKEKIVDIARKSGVSTAAIRGRLGRIYKRLETLLSERG
jgi:DNA-directed RNA polymerase specialized sigma24 family protein